MKAPRAMPLRDDRASSWPCSASVNRTVTVLPLCRLSVPLAMPAFPCACTHAVPRVVPLAGPARVLAWLQGRGALVGPDATVRLCGLSPPHRGPGRRNVPGRRRVETPGLGSKGHEGLLGQGPWAERPGQGSTGLKAPGHGDATGYGIAPCQASPKGGCAV